MYNILDIKAIHLEVTQNCQAACPMCDRNMRGEGVNPHINLDELTLEDCKAIFKPEFVAQLNTMFMCGNLGDPIVARDTLEIFSYFREHNPRMWLSMNTNAGARDEEWWTELAKVYGRMGAVIFSVDGLRDTNHIYRQNVVWDNVERSMRAFVNAGGRARWDFLVFEHNQHQVDEAKALADEIGFERFIPKKTDRFVTAKKEKKEEHQAKNKKGKEAALLKKPDEKYQNPVRKKQDILLEKYGTMQKYYDAVPIKCKVKEQGSLFITAEGLALPCCWTGSRMYKWYHEDPTIEPIWRYIEDVGGKQKLNAKQGLDKVFATGIFDNIQNGWSKSSCAEGKLSVCAEKCGIEFDPYTAQWSTE